MLKKVLGGVVVVLAVLAAASMLRTRTVFASEGARQALATQLSQALGQPVSIGRMRADGILGLSLALEDVSIGQPARVQVHAVVIRGGLSSLLSRRLDRARLAITGAEITLPAPALTFSAPTADADAPVRLLSVGTIVLDDVQIVTRGRRLRLAAELEPHGDRGLAIRRGSVVADSMHLDVSGDITDRTVPRGELTAKADVIDGDLMLTLLSELGERPATGSQGPDAMDGGGENAAPAADTPGIAVTLSAERASLGVLRLSDVAATATIRREATTFEPLAFGLLGGTYKGQMEVRYAGAIPAIRWYGDLANINLGDLMSQADAGGTLSGRLTGDIDLTGAGTDFARAMRAARGSARVAISDGVIGKLGIVKSVMAAAAADPQAAAQDPATGPPDTAFRTLSTALTISGASASLLDTRLESDDVAVVGGGGLRLDGSAITAFVDVQLSEPLSHRLAGSRGLTVPTGSRLSVPATIRGGTARYSIEVNMPEMRPVKQ